MTCAVPACAIIAAVYGAHEQKKVEEAAGGDKPPEKDRAREAPGYRPGPTAAPPSPPSSLTPLAIVLGIEAMSSSSSCGSDFTGGGGTGGGGGASGSW